MNATDVLTIDRWGDPGVSIDATVTSATSMSAMVGASHGSLAFHMGHMGAGLGWHGFVLDPNPSTLLEFTR